jgi:hypothetical protein
MEAQADFFYAGGRAWDLTHEDGKPAGPSMDFKKLRGYLLPLAPVWSKNVAKNVAKCNIDFWTPVAC